MTAEREAFMTVFVISRMIAVSRLDRMAIRYGSILLSVFRLMFLSTASFFKIFWQPT